MRKSLILFLALIGLLISGGVQAQNMTARVVTACGANSMTVGNIGAVLQDANGNLCTGVGSSATESINITQVGSGAVPSLGTGILGVAIAPTSTAAAGITPVVSASAEATHVIKASGGNLYSVYATNLTTTTGFLAIVNATSAPADGAITPLDCVVLPPSGSASINYAPGPPAAYSTGITAILTSAATCLTKTTGVITGFIHGSAS